jgi:hypothetical protein
MHFRLDPAPAKVRENAPPVPVNQHGSLSKKGQPPAPNVVYMNLRTPMQYSASMRAHYSLDNLMHQPQQIHTHRYLVSHNPRRALEQRSEAVATTKLPDAESRLLNGSTFR